MIDSRAAARFAPIAIGLVLTGSAHGQALFADVTAAAGLSPYRASTGDGHGPGAVFADLNNDGFADLYLVRAGFPSANLLVVNIPGPDGQRLFAPAAGGAGAGDTGNATGAIAGDYDNDGDLDLYVLNFDQPNALLRNQFSETGILQFVDVTAQTDPTPNTLDDQFGVGIAVFDGVPLDNTLTAAWADVDRDGDLDLYVGNHNGFFGSAVEGPFALPGRRDVFYLNNGDGTFTDVTMQYGVTGYVSAQGEFQTATQRFSSTNAVIFADFNNDRWPDLLVTNKIGGPDDRDMLYLNMGSNGQGTWLGFQMVTWLMEPPFGHLSGAAMGVDVGDPDNDGDLDIYITDWSDPNTPEAPGNNDLWLSGLAQTGAFTFNHIGGLAAKFSWGAQWQDFDNDGRQDLHVTTSLPFHDFLYMIDETGVVEASAAAGVDQVQESRGNVAADYNRDGWIDLFVVNLGGVPSVLYENRSSTLQPEHGFLNVTLAGDPAAMNPFRSSRDAIGARAIVRADLDGDGLIGPGESQLRDVVSGSGNAGSTSSLELEFGLGHARSALLEILWPSGGFSSFIVSAGAFLEIDEANLVTGDVNADGIVGIQDFLFLLSAWGPCPGPPVGCPGDLDGDGEVFIVDLLIMFANWTAH